MPITEDGTGMCLALLESEFTAAELIDVIEFFLCDNLRSYSTEFLKKTKMQLRFRMEFYI